VLSILSGLLIRLPYQPFHWSPVAFIALVPLFWGLRRCSPRLAFWVSLPFGFLHGIYGIGWATSVARFNPLVYLGIPIGALWWGAHLAAGCALIIFFLRRFSPTAGLVLAMLSWWAMEHFRSVGRLGLPIGFLGHGLAGWESLALAASFAGVPLLSALIVGMNLALMELIASLQKGYGQAHALARNALMLGLIGLAWFSGGRVLDSRTQAYEEDGIPLRLALVQTGIDQELKFNSYADPSEEVRRTLQDEMYRRLVKQLATIDRGEADLIVTPESSLTHDYVDAEPEVQRQLAGGVVLAELLQMAQEARTPIVVGGVDNEFSNAEGERTERALEALNADGEFYDRDVYGATWLLRPEDQLPSPTATYRKSFLMPFGEEVPYLDLIPGFQEHIVQVGTFNKAPMGDPIGMLLPEDEKGKRAEVRLGFTICFEDLIPKLHRHYAALGAQVFINTTNDAWFDGSSGPAWHAEMARWRSIETGIPMVRCTNSGLTVVIGPTGRFEDTLPLLDAAILRATVRVLPEAPRSLYSRIGDLLGWIIMLGIAGGWWVLVRRPEE
jgi:apolipoprotein N-acyltransferase